jgi:starch synthase
VRQVLSVASECAPLVKTGGLADVVGALPAALKVHGWETRTLLPGYPKVMAALEGAAEVAADPNLFGGAARLLSGQAGRLDLFVLDAPHLYDRPGLPYGDPDGKDWPDNPERFAALAWAAAGIAATGARGWTPEVVHAHDWQAGLAPYYLRQAGTATPALLTIHNVAFQGLAPAARLSSLRLDRADFTQDGFEYWGQISALKAGVAFAARVTTVSPTYARELRTEEFGMGLQGMLRARETDLSGILNGIDMEIWDPATDPMIRARYRTARGKARNKRALRREFGLPDTPGPLAIVISRLTHQKGLDLLLEALPAFVDRGGQLAVLGSGDPELERAFAAAAASHPLIAVRIGYDEGLSHRMFAGADAVLVPSRFEPCGLTQLYGLRYGAIPLVAYTGGLVDTVIDSTPMALRSGVATGIQFHPITSDALAAALIRLVDLYNDSPTWSRLQANAMRQPVGWDGSAAEYAALYEAVTANR